MTHIQAGSKVVGIVGFAMPEALGWAGLKANKVGMGGQQTSVLDLVSPVTIFVTYPSLVLSLSLPFII